MKQSIRIERNNHKVQGHDGYGRYDLLGKKSARWRQTENQAAIAIGRSIIKALHDYCETEHIDMIRDKVGVRLYIDFKKYQRQA